MICNIVDHRTYRYRWKRIDAIVEPTWHDNTCQDADLAEVPSSFEDEIRAIYDEPGGISLAEAIAWASLPGYPVTLYLYDDGAAIKPRQSSDLKKSS